MRFPVLLDTYTLYGFALCDLLLRLAEANTYRPLWSADILDELERNLVENQATTPEAGHRRVKAMQSFFEDALVTGYRDLEPILECDPKDRHVLRGSD